MRVLKSVTERIVQMGRCDAPTVWFIAGVAAVVTNRSRSTVQLEPKYRLADQVPDKEQALAATAQLDAEADRRQSRPRHDRVERRAKVSMTPRPCLSLPRLASCP